MEIKTDLYLDKKKLKLSFLIEASKFNDKKASEFHMRNPTLIKSLLSIISLFYK